MGAIPYDLTCWYLNARRIVELSGVVPQGNSQLSGQMVRLNELRQLKGMAIEWMRQNNPHPLEVLLVEKKLAIGTLFTHHSNFFFSGLSKVADAKRRNKPTPSASAYSKLDEWRTGARLQFDFNAEHLTSNSSWSELSGQKRSLVLGVVTDLKGEEIKCSPYVIANIVDPSSALQGFGGLWQFHLEVHVSQVDSFAKVELVKDRLTKKSLAPLSKIPEADIKSAIADIINEPVIPKDWGGESSDLFSSRVILDGQRVSTAFLLKGPAKFHPMTPADLGKNGDQIGRLFDEPADLLVLQHCHEVTSAVRKQMRAYAQQMGNPRRFCIVDGYDTIRMLRAYNKCGLALDDSEAGGT